jgi:uncharacterized protein with FMN-binding domain
MARLERLGSTSKGSGSAAPKPRKRHAAKGSRTAAVAMSIATTAGLTAWFQHADASSSGTVTLTGVATASPTTTPTAATTATTTVATTAATAPATTVNSSGLADGTYTGATSTNRWGPVQVQITVSGGSITDVVALQTPNDDGKSVAINSRAVPVLVSETLSAQSANVDTVSGATYTSNSYAASLQSAIDLARTTAQQASG